MPSTNVATNLDESTVIAVQLEGSYEFNVARDKIWQALNDPNVLARAAPGVESLDEEGEDRFRATLKLNVGPVSGTFEGTAEIRDRTEGEALTLYMQGEGGPGGVEATGKIHLSDQDGGTKLDYTGDAQITGTLAGVGGRLVNSVAKKMANQFFKQIEKEAQAL